MKSLLILGAGRPQLPAYRTARGRGLRTIALDANAAAPGMALADTSYAVDPTDAEAATTIGFQEDVDGVLTLGTDDTARALATLCKALKVPGLETDAALRASHKGSMRDACARRGAPVPRYRRTFDLDEAAAAAVELGLPVLLKPVTASGSAGISRVETIDQMAAAHALARAASAGATEVLVEEIVDGPEVRVETLSYGGQHHLVAMSDVLEPDSVLGGSGVVAPSRLPKVAQTQIKIATLAALDALGLMTSAAHVDVRVGRRGPRILEIGPSLGDALVCEIVLRSSGVDLVDAAIDLALGETPKLKATRYDAAAVRWVMAPAGRVVGVSGLEEARRLPGVVAVDVALRPGDVVLPAAAGRTRFGHVIAEATEPSLAESRAAAAIRLLKLEVAPVR
jgi:biotin carboxylase